jgi:hypothetical protein
MQSFSFHSSCFNKDGSVCGLLRVVVLSVDKSGTSSVRVLGNQKIFCSWNKETKLYRYILDLAVTYWNWFSSGCRVITPLAGRPRNPGSISKTSRPNCPLSLLFGGYQILSRSDSCRGLKLKNSPQYRSLTSPRWISVRSPHFCLVCVPEFDMPVLFIS